MRAASLSNKGGELLFASIIEAHQLSGARSKRSIIRAQTRTEFKRRRRDSQWLSR